MPQTDRHKEREIPIEFDFYKSGITYSNGYMLLLAVAVFSVQHY